MPKKSYRENRFRYQRLDSKREYCGCVIVELGDDPLDERGMEFFDQESGEVRWYPFVPEDVEREEVKRLLAERRGGLTDGCVRIDVAELRRGKHSRTPATFPSVGRAPRPSEDLPNKGWRSK